MTKRLGADAELFTVVGVSKGTAVSPRWRCGIRVEVVAANAFLIAYLVSGVPRPIENVKVEFSD